MDRFLLLAPALFLFTTFVVTLIIFGALSAAGKQPQVSGAKHNQLFGAFLGRYIVWLLRPLERLLFGRVSPNAVTAMSLVMCAVTGAAAALGHLAGAVWLFAFAGILDVLDGRLARLAGRQTQSGALFDSVSDRWGELLAYAGYIWYLHDSPWLFAAMLTLGGSMMVSYTRARAEGLGVQLSGGMMQRAERMVLVQVGTLIAAWYGVNPDNADAIAPIIGTTMLLCGVASCGTAVSRWVLAFRELARRDQAKLEAAAAVVDEPSSLPLAPARTFSKSRPLEQN